jgi:hypothetical protein
MADVKPAKSWQVSLVANERVRVALLNRSCGEKFFLVRRASQQEGDISNRRDKERGPWCETGLGQKPIAVLVCLSVFWRVEPSGDALDILLAACRSYPSCCVCAVRVEGRMDNNNNNSTRLTVQQQTVPR